MYVPNVFEINKVKINENKVVGEFYAIFFLVMFKNNLQEQFILGFICPTGPVTV